MERNVNDKRVRHRRHANPFNLRASPGRLDESAAFGRKAPIALDVGCGPGRFVLDLARQNPDWNVLGIEIRPHLVQRILRHAQAENLQNVHAVLGNANLHLDDLLAPNSLVFVSVCFPDPWFKKRHHKRRVIQPDWLDLLTTKMQPGAELHLVTDFEPIATDALELLRDHARLQAVDGDRFLPYSSTGIATEREIMHLDRGDPIYRLYYRLTPDSQNA